MGRDLVSRGHGLRTRCDTEVILHLYEELGERCLEHLRGMFSFAIWDSRRQSLFLARNRLGIKPLHYMLQGGRLIFASEIKSILAHGGLPRRVDERAMCEYLTFLCVGGERTMFEGIRKLPPGHWLKMDSQGLSVQQYWDLQPQEPLPPDEARLKEELRGRLAETVKLHLVSDVPVAAFLSGGVDSSAVVAMMAQARDERPITVTARFNNAQYDESRFARRVAEQFQTRHFEELVNAEALQVTQTLSRQFDEPFADYSAIPTYCISRAAIRHAKVALSGDGGDENFAGYRRHRWAMAEHRVRRWLPGWLRHGLLGPLGQSWPDGNFRRTLLNLASDPAEAYARTLSDFRDARTLLTPEFRRGLGDFHPWQRLVESMNRFDGSPLEKLLYADTKTYLPDDILTKVDRASMAVSLEVRVPLLDHTLVEFAHRVPPEMKIRGDQGKMILEQAMRVLGDEILFRPKHGFEPPVADWLRGPLKELAGDLLASPGALYPRYVRSDVVGRMWREHQQGSHNHVGMLWTVVMLELWAREYAKP